MFGVSGLLKELINNHRWEVNDASLQSVEADTAEISTTVLKYSLQKVTKTWHFSSYG